MRIWIDTDIGSDVDDALTLAYVLGHPGFELVGLSTVFGDIELRTRIASELLAIGDAASVPLLPGLGVPLTPRKRGVMFGHEGLGLIDDLDADPELRVAEEAGGPAAAEHRIGAMAEAIEAARPDVLLAIGPLTNIAALSDVGMTLPRLAIMGGKLRDVMLPGMVEQISEWNWFCDPVAVQKVLTATHDELPLVVPAEVTFRTKLGDGDVEALADGDPMAQMLSVLCGHWLDAQRTLFGRDEPRVALHDPLTAALLVEPDLCPVEDRSIEVDDHGAARAVHGDANVSAAYDVDPEAVRRHLMDRWLNNT